MKVVINYKINNHVRDRNIGSLLFSHKLLSSPNHYFPTLTITKYIIIDYVFIHLHLSRFNAALKIPEPHPSSSGIYQVRLGHVGGLKPPTFPVCFTVYLLIGSKTATAST